MFIVMAKICLVLCGLFFAGIVGDCKSKNEKNVALVALFLSITLGLLGAFLK